MARKETPEETSARLAKAAPMNASNNEPPPPSSLDGFEDLFPNGIDITLRDGKKVNVQAFDFAELAEAARYVVEFGVAFDQLNLTDPAVILGLMTHNVEPVFRLVTMFARASLKNDYPDEFKNDEDVLKYVKKLKGIDGVKITTAGARMNKDFFDQAKSVVTTLFPDALAKLPTNQQTSAQEKIGSFSSPIYDEGGQEKKSTE